MRFMKALKQALVYSLLPINLILSMSEKVELVEVQKINSSIKVDVVYATKNNFTNQVIYTAPKCMLLKEVALALNKVQEELAQLQEELGQKKLGLKVWDAYRPMSAQKKFWDVLAERYPNEAERENYVSNPKKGGRHTRGTAVDCTLVDLETGAEVEKPTDFDHFGEEAWRNYNGPKLTEKAKMYRALLEQVMHKHGFEGLPSEWWHFDYKGWQNCKPLDIEF